MKRIVIFSALALFNISNTAAAPPDPIRESILARAHKAEKGVIVAVTDRGDVAADTAWLLSAQIMQDDRYAPLLLALKPEERDSVLKMLNLPGTALPALIFYDRHGREINRIIGALPSRLIKQARTSNSALN